MTKHAMGNSVRQKLSDLSKKLEVSYENIETAFIIERLVARLIVDENLSKHLVFKGGFVGLRVYNSERYTVDLDALLVKAHVEPALSLTKKKAETDLDDGVWFRFEGQVDLAAQGEYGGTRQIYRAGIGEVLKNLNKAQVIHFDLGIGDPITPGPQKIKIPSLLSKVEEISWSVYPIETICAEKLHALVSHGNTNSRSKDIYDLSVFLAKAEAPKLAEALKKCFSFRETGIPESFSKTIKAIDTTSLQRGWLSAIATVPNAPEFKEAFDSVVKQMAKLERAFK